MDQERCGAARRGVDHPCQVALGEARRRCPATSWNCSTDTRWKTLAKEKGLIGTIFRKAQNKLTDPAKLKRVVSLIDAETWIGIGVDVKGAIYEGLLERNAAEVKSGAGQYFTPRPLIKAMVAVIDPAHRRDGPRPGVRHRRLSAVRLRPHEELSRRTAPDSASCASSRLSGVDIVDEVARLCVMNLYLHGIGDGDSPIRSADALASDPGERYDVGSHQSAVRQEVAATWSSARTARWTPSGRTTSAATSGPPPSTSSSTSCQHIMTVLESNGRAGVVLPDNVLFEGGARAKASASGCWSSSTSTRCCACRPASSTPGVKANVLFFDKRAPRADGKPNSQGLWIYDLRTNMHFTLKKNPLQPSDLDDFVACYSAGNRGRRKETERFKRFGVDDLLKRDKLNLDIFWLKDESLDDVDSLPPPDEIAAEIVENLQAALEAFQAVAEELAVPK